MKSKLAAVAALVFACGANAAENLLPSEFTVLVNHALKANPGVDRKSVTTPLIERVRTEDLSEIERYMKGEVHFLHLEPEDARDEFWEFRDRNDDLGRVAWQRLMVIRINGFQMVDELLERDIPEYTQRFGVRADDRYGISFPIQRTAQLLAERGDPNRALDLVAEHVRQHEQFDAPYSAYALPGQFFALAAENDRAEEFSELTQWVLNGLNNAIEERLANPGDGRPKASGVPGEIFFSMFVDRSLDDYEWTAEFLKLRDRIEAGIASARGRPGQ
ncbi:MAG: hypothetical protein AAF417_00305 [Pseudomonadota bacterium]